MKQIHYNSLLKGCALAAKAGDKDAVPVAYGVLQEMRTAKVPSPSAFSSECFSRTMELNQGFVFFGMRVV
jgi:hypothetical protein